MTSLKSHEKHPYSKTLIRYQDCDPLGHLNNGRYIDYFMNAREDHLREYYDLDIYEISKNQGFGWVVVQNQVTYLKPAFLNEVVVIESMLIYFDTHSVIVEFKMWNETKTHLKSVMWTRFVSVDVKTGKKTPISKEFYLLKEILVEVETSVGFEKRIARIINEIKAMV